MEHDRKRSERNQHQKQVNRNTAEGEKGYCYADVSWTVVSFFFSGIVTVQTSGGMFSLLRVDLRFPTLCWASGASQARFVNPCKVAACWTLGGSGLELGPAAEGRELEGFAATG